MITVTAGYVKSSGYLRQASVPVLPHPGLEECKSFETKMSSERKLG